MHLRVRLGGGVSAHGTGRDRALRAESEFARQQFVRAARVHHQHDEVGLRSADLEAEAAAFDPHRRRRRPSSPFLAAEKVALPYLPPNTNAAVFSPGTITMQWAFSSRSRGMPLSGRS